jgi:3-dehydroquinate synthase
MTIASHKGPYEVAFDDDALAALDADPPQNAHFIVDRRVTELYRDQMRTILTRQVALLVDATEDAKSLHNFPTYVEQLVERRVRRGAVLVAIGGGIVQDITCFLAATFLRGIDWRFYPTTLLAQADSCVGSKSSINAGTAKNILGTFTPPRSVHVSTRFLDTLDERDVRSGVGEILKAHAIAGPAAFDAIARDYDRMFRSREVMLGYVRRALEIKKPYVEKDEFDRNVRNVFNYGHSFGHAIEAATDFAVPHGIGVTMGMDMANFTAVSLSVAPETVHARMHPTLRANYRGFERCEVPLDRFFAALAKDKKNVGADLTLIQPAADGNPIKRAQPFDESFRAACARYFESARLA